MLASSEFRQEHFSTIHSHVIVALDDWYIDLTLNQFAEHRDRVVIGTRTGTLGSLLTKIKRHRGKVNTRTINIHTANEDGGRHYS